MVAAVRQHHRIERPKFEYVGSEADGLDDREDVAFDGVPGGLEVIHPNKFVDQVHPDPNEGGVCLRQLVEFHRVNASHGGALAFPAGCLCEEIERVSQMFQMIGIITALGKERGQLRRSEEHTSELQSLMR